MNLAVAVDRWEESGRTGGRALDDAMNAKAFERGWLPPLLPDGSTDIVEVNDLDINSGTGSFRFPVEAMSHYLEAIGCEHGGIVTKSPSGSGIAISVTNENTHWSIELDPQKGMGSYFVQSR